MLGEFFSNFFFLVEDHFLLCIIKYKYEFFDLIVILLIVDEHGFDKFFMFLLYPLYFLDNVICSTNDIHEHHRLIKEVDVIEMTCKVTNCLMIIIHPGGLIGINH